MLACDVVVSSCVVWLPVWLSVGVKAEWAFHSASMQNYGFVPSNKNPFVRPVFNAALINLFDVST